MGATWHSIVLSFISLFLVLYAVDGGLVLCADNDSQGRNAHCVINSCRSSSRRSPPGVQTHKRTLPFVLPQ
ncbi:hypothetical protein EDD17DRAFT_1105021 [Pisolithus thermaeus]|nr:hypothetical protein EV401DRAFT_2042789 [Pisolithus croceorrhizus]KAI6109815.1 hypothetical protein F5141DRAFT_1116833 [Pisolithus sp. B1]KAI6167021.1 hypothetical protein EDD17DRAFT_1105021 [Pisolithus thermaeus]